jgi:hypothetical protein
MTAEITTSTNGYSVKQVTELTKFHAISELTESDQQYGIHKLKTL